MNPKMKKWINVQEKFQDLSNSISQLSVFPFALGVSFGGQEDGTLPLWSTRIRTLWSEFDMILHFEDLRSPAFIHLIEGEYEPEIQNLILQHLGDLEDPVFLDVGANEGFHSINVFKALPNTKVISLEPNPEVFLRLEKNAKENLIESNMELIPIGLGNSEGQSIPFFVPTITGTVGGSLRPLPWDEEHYEFRIEIKTLDSLDVRPSLIKVDVEGSELSVIEGGKETIKECRPVIIIELLRKWMAPFGTHPQMVLELLNGFGYEAYAIGPNSLRPISIIDDDTLETNFLFRPKLMINSQGAS